MRSAPTLAGLLLGTGSDGSEIRALIIRNFQGDGGGIGIEIASGGNGIFGNYIGTDSSGLETSPNAIGISVDSGSENVIGGIGLEQNVISGNSGVAAAGTPSMSPRAPTRR